MKVLYVDCFSGLAGDMMLGALLDLGVPEDFVRQELSKLALGEWRLDVSRTLRHGISAIDVKVHDLEHRHDNQHGDHDHGRHWSEIRQLIESSNMDGGAKVLAVKIFLKLAEAEAKLHNKSIEEIHFHEVGAVDAIVDICGVAIALNWLDCGAFVSAPVPTPRGWVKCTHGNMPLPAPATMELLRGATTQQVDAAGEWVTPTGAAILAGLEVTYGPIPAMKVQSIGYGAGDKDPPERANLLRLILGEVANSQSETYDLVVEANIDDMTPELFGHLTERLLSLGVHDVWMTPIQMKKGRPGITVSVLCKPTAREDVIRTLLTESTTIGVRISAVERYKTVHSIETVDTALGPVRVKVARDGDQVVNTAPEFEDCRRIAQENDLPLKEVIREVWGVIGASTK